MTDYWKGKTVWIIGASSGIGAELTKQLVGRGAKVAISARSEDLLLRVAVCADDTTGMVVAVPVDVTDANGLSEAGREVERLLGPLDLLIYSAGAWTPTDPPIIDMAAIERQVQVNYVGMIRAVSVVLPGMMARRNGVIAGVASATAYLALPRAEGYGSTKAATNYFLRSLRGHVRRSNVRVVTINPGFVKTRLTADNDFPMPFIMEVEQAAAEVVRGLENGKVEIHFPRRLTLPMKFLNWLPRSLSEWILVRAFRV
ncbi:MAG: SDR family NAD(P)-dependent oxidoreductase [SAR202 cluster bacterium]|nr:SDR family NAD(P)-dependent oxidoreductase [SAR202 cluster bacterium]